MDGDDVIWVRSGRSERADDETESMQVQRRRCVHGWPGIWPAMAAMAGVAAPGPARRWTTYAGTRPGQGSNV